jgi:hypothetical protein
MKKEFKTLQFMILGLLLLVILNLSSLSSDLSAKNETLENFVQSQLIQSLSTPSEVLGEIALDIKKQVLLDPELLFEQEEQTKPKETTVVEEEKDEMIDVEDDTIIYEPEQPSDFIQPEKTKIQLPIKVLLIGDSLIIEKFGPYVEQTLLTYEGVEVYREGHYSTGLNRIDYYDWFSRTRELINSYQPDILVIYVGANDGQHIRAYDGTYCRWPSTAWDVAYKERVMKYFEEFSPEFMKIYWIGHPIPRTTDFQNKFSKMNDLYMSSSNLFENVIYINSWDRFAVDGKYSPTLADDDGLVQYVKASDGVHLTQHGSKILTDLLLDYMGEDIDLDNPDYLNESSN